MINLFVISDLHLGGRPHGSAGAIGETPGSQINSSYSRLADFIDWVGSAWAEEGDVELILNGDIVDFLLEDEGILPCPWTDNEDEAITKLNKIVARTRPGGQRGPFDAMKAFLKAGHTLTFILGNHDVELSFPGVRRHLSSILDAGKGHMRFIYDGEAYVRGDLLIEHGNRYDRFNVIDHSALRQERSTMSRGLPLHNSARCFGRFQPPAGSLLVTEILNPIKREYRFLDLLKPETEAVVPLLLTLHPKLEYGLAALLTLTKVASRSFSSRMRNPAEPRRSGELGAVGGDSPLTLTALLQQALDRDAALFEVSASDPSSLLGVGDRWENFKSLTGNIARYLLDESNLFSAWSAENKRREQLLASLSVLRNDRTFDLQYEAPPYLDAAQWLAKSGRFSTILFGHTHLPKQMEIEIDGLPPAQYINTGTWADVMHVPHAIFDTADETRAHQALDAFVGDLKANRLDDYIAHYLCYARVRLDGDEKVASAELLSFVSREMPAEAPTCQRKNV